MSKNKLMQGDCLERMAEIPDNSIDAIVTDPPYGLSFMGKKWDYDVPSVEIWAECLRVLKPGGHLLAFAGTRTQHRMAVRIEDAGFEIRDMIAWVYGSGFPKSLDVSKAIDKAAGVEREKKRVPYSQNVMAQGIGVKRPWMDAAAQAGYHELQGDTPATEAARQWQGWGTALKPALEPITVARKPLIGTVAENVLAHGTGAMNINGCRVSTDDVLSGSGSVPLKHGGQNHRPFHDTAEPRGCNQSPLGRWPANLIHDGSEEVVGMFPNNNPGCKPHVVTASDATAKSNKEKGWGSVSVPKEKFAGFDDGENKSAARFFYQAKTSKKDRNEGCEHLPEHQEGLQLPRGKCPECGTWKNAGEERCKCGGEWELTSNPPPKANNNHPTVKPTALMRYLCRLVTPPSGVVLDPFMGSGSTGKAAALEGFDFIGIERDPEYYKIAEARINNAKTKKLLI